jgi:tetratricopeptide (TPR) repeat protein
VLEKALRLQAERPRPWKAEDYYRQAVLLRSLNQLAAAIAPLQEALTLKPEQTQWRYELALLFYQEKRLAEARRELEQLLKQQPDHARAAALLQRLNGGVHPLLGP